jgi:hypothetical protein
MIGHGKRQTAGTASDLSTAKLGSKGFVETDFAAWFAAVWAHMHMLSCKMLSLVLLEL